ncbi:MAG: hypothetical protein JST90_17915 [Bacteroidetes bacterium]|nr:hypothetical protein [Bacteroidota bacterium]
MNLNYDQQPEALIELLAKADQSISDHHIAVDYDGEVLLDPQVQYPHVPLHRYRFHTRVWQAGMRSTQKLRELHHTLITLLHTGADHGDLSLAA